MITWMTSDLPVTNFYFLHTPTDDHLDDRGPTGHNPVTPLLIYVLTHTHPHAY